MDALTLHSTTAVQPLHDQPDGWNDPEGDDVAVMEEVAVTQETAETVQDAQREEIVRDVPSMIGDAADRWGLDPQTMLRIAWCESRWDPNARGPGGAAGVFQIVPQTWSWASAAAGMGGTSPFDATANVETASWLMKAHGPREWGCR